MITLSTMQSLNESVSYNPYDDIPLEDLGAVVESAIMNEGIGHDIWDGIKKIWGKIVSAIRTLINKIKNFFSGLFNKNKAKAEAVTKKIESMPDEADVSAKNKDASKEHKFTINTFFELASSSTPLSDDTVNAVIASASGVSAGFVRSVTQKIVVDYDDEKVDSFNKISGASIDTKSPEVLKAAGMYEVDGNWVLNCYKKQVIAATKAKHLKKISRNINAASANLDKFLNEISKTCKGIENSYESIKTSVEQMAKQKADDANAAKLCKAQAAACGKKLSLVSSLCAMYCTSIKAVTEWNVWMLSQYTDFMGSEYKKLNNSEHSKKFIDDMNDPNFTLVM